MTSIKLEIQTLTYSAALFVFAEIIKLESMNLNLSPDHDLVRGGNLQGTFYGSAEGSCRTTGS